MRTRLRTVKKPTLIQQFNLTAILLIEGAH
ncbi:hypothetical protein PAV_1c09700 [Paenibacillus alvei DSM 29]|nr:hypothetical protein PAV_1c09700 [Paenibacillus alvei DSM 29]